MMELLRSVVVALLVLHLSMAQATPCRSSDYVEMKTNCINGLQTLSKLKKPHIYCTGEASILVGLVPCSLKKASLSDRGKALLADAAGVFITDRMLYYIDQDVGVIGAGRKSLGLQAMYINGEQIGFIAYSFRDLLKLILFPISLLMYPINGILLHDLLMGTDVYYINVQPNLSPPSHSIEVSNVQETKEETLFSRMLNFLPYWNTPLSSYVDHYYFITWQGFFVCFIAGIFAAKFHALLASSSTIELDVQTTIRWMLTLAYALLCVSNFYGYSFKNAYWYYVLCHLDGLSISRSGPFAVLQLVKWFILLRNEESFCNEAWLLVSINCVSSAAALWMRKRTIADVFFVARLLEIAHVLYLFIIYSSNPLIIIPLLSESPALVWIVAWIARGYLPVGVCYLMCIAFYCLELRSRIRRQSVSSNPIPPATIDTIANASYNGKIVAGRWLRDNTTKKSNFTNPTDPEEEYYNSDEDSSYEESQDTYESSYDDSSLSDNEAVEASDYQINMQTNAKCIVCSGNPRTVMVLPCHHVCFCAFCSTKLSNQFNLGYMYRFHCPVCKHCITGLVTAVL